MFPLAQRAAWMLIAAVTGMLVLDILGINISPLMAGFGITGVAVALALQSTLGQFLRRHICHVRGCRRSR